MDKRQKQIAVIAGLAILAYLAYRYYTSQSASNTTSGAAGTTAPDTSSSDYAALAGQEQADVAALQGQNSQLQATEQSDAAQEQSDVSGITGMFGGVANTLDQITGAQSTLGNQIAALATGVQKVNRAQNATVATHRGGPFYKYYKSVTGKAPPAQVAASSFIYQAWKSGVKAAALKPTQHSSSKNTHVAHPNPNHESKTAKKPPAKAPARHTPKSSGKSKAKVSGTRK